LRHGKPIHEGEIAALKHHQDDVREVRQGFECGISFKNFNDFAVGDIVECYVIEEKS
jgi:translation initiation factor IF-2